MKLRPGMRTAIAAGVPLAAGFAAVASASAFDAVAVRIALQFFAVAVAALMAWRAGVLSMSREVAGAVEPAAVTTAEVATITTDRRRPTFDRETGLCVNWYFRLRVEEEIARAARYGQRFTMLALSAGPEGDLSAPRLAIKRLLRNVDLAGEIGDRLAVLLPNTEHRGAEKVVARIAKLDPSVDVRIAEYPADGTTMTQLLGDDVWGTSEADQQAS